MNTREHEKMKMRGSADVSYLGRTVDAMVWDFMEEQKIPGLTLAIVQAPYIPRVVGYGVSDAGQRRLASANTMWPVGPISQAFAAVAVMQLCEDGKIHPGAAGFLEESYGPPVIAPRVRTSGLPAGGSLEPVPGVGFFGAAESCGRQRFFFCTGIRRGAERDKFFAFDRDD